MTKIMNNIIYDKQKQLAVDIYMPDANKSNDRVLLFWHGGGWIRGDKEDLTDLGSKIADQGFTVFIPNYSLAPRYTYPAAHQDSDNFVKWLLKSSYIHQASGADKKVTQIGASSGGVMALYLAGKYGFLTVTWSAPVNYSDWMNDHTSVKPAVDAQNELGLTKPDDINASFYKYFALTYAGQNDPKIFNKLDAEAYDYQKLTQLLMINSTDELTPVKYLLAFVNRLAKNGHGVDLKIIPGNKHAMAYAKQYLMTSLTYLAGAI